MNQQSVNPHDVSQYAELIETFLLGKIDAPSFERTYLRAFKDEQRIFGDEIYQVLQELFEDVDAYVENPQLRTEPEDLDEAQLIQSARNAHDRLLDIAGRS